MIVERISILNFKNITEADLLFSPKMNCFFGNNGMGKTNLLDALYYLSFTKSHNNLNDSQLIRHNEEICVLQGFYTGEGTEEAIYCGIKRKHRKVFKRNKKEYDRLSEHIGLIPLVMVSPDDIVLIKGGSEERRKFTDMIISQYDKDYLNHLIQYNRALHQRNTLLRNDYPPDDALFEVIEEQMVVHAGIIYSKRKAFFNDFLPLFRDYYSQISRGGDEVDLCYQSQLDKYPLAQLFDEKRGKDKILGYTTTGIHRDELDFLLDNYLIRKIGSQGQNKTYLIALKLAQFGFLAKKGSSMPILLLDDIFDKLDTPRVEQIIRLVADNGFGQIFITDTNRKHLDEILTSMDHEYKLFEVNNGVVDEML